MRGYSQVWGDTVRQSTCRSRNCHKPIWFATNARTGTDMPFDVRPVVTAIQPELETGRQLWTVSLQHTHFATCVDAPSFRTKGHR